MITPQTTSAATSVLDRRVFDRRVFMLLATGFSLAVLAGFARTYYFKVLFGTPPLPSALVHVHGLVMTAWVLLFVVQTRLIAAKQVRTHQRLGYAGVGLGVLIIATGLPVALRAAKYGSAATPGGIAPLLFLIVPLTDLVMFVLLFGGAIYFRRSAATHKSLMLLTAVNLLPPALARIPVAALLALGPLWFFGVPSLLALAYMVVDTRRRGRLNRVAAAATLVMIASYVGRLAMMSTATWQTVATWATSFV